MVILTAFRNFRRHLSFTLINVLGLGLGIGACLLIFLVVRNELSYDNYHRKANRIYRLTMHGLDYNPSVSFAIAPALKAYYPELEQVSQSWFQHNGMVKVGEQRYHEKGYFYADQAFLNTFDFQWLAGDRQKALLDPNTVVLTQSMANKYFGKANPIGQVIRLDNEYDLTVTGLIKDQPANTHLPFLFLASFQTLWKELNPPASHFWNISGGSTYIVLPEHYNVNQLRNSLPAFLKSNWGDEIAKEAPLLLQPLNEIHYDTRYSSGTASDTVAKDTYWALGAVGLLIILIAAINFINLTTAQSAKRAKEVGVRKVLGAGRGQLIRQFMVETGVLVLVAVILGVAGAALFLTKASTWLDININATALREPIVLLFLAALALVLILLAGLYPAFVQSGFKPAAAFRSVRMPVVRGFSLRKSLVVVQFVISQMLIIGTLVVAYQMDFFQNRDLGFNKEAVVSFPLPDRNKREVIAQQLAAVPGVQAMSFSSGAPGYSSSFAPFKAPELGIDKDDVTELKFLDENYMSLLKIDMLAGEGIVKLNSIDTLNRVVVNEALIHKLGIQDPQKAIGVSFLGSGQRMLIKGVMQDFQSESKHKARRPLIAIYNPNRFFNVTIKLEPGKVMESMSRIDQLWSSAFPEQLFKYEFLDERIAGFYKQEQKVYTAFRLFAGIAILIGCLGLYGLITYAAIQRTKEVGIRKVLGASMGRIAYLFCQEFIVLILIAFCVAAPIAWFLMNNWLQNFAYHVHISAGVFLVAIIASFAIAALTILSQVMRAAVANPVKALRSE